MISERALFAGREVMLESDGSDHIVNALDSASLQARLKRHGVLLLRGFSGDGQDFSELIQRCSRRVTLDPARRHTAANAQLVDAGTDAIGLHLENGNAPLLPDVIGFYCELAASAGSQTTICDGEAALSALPAEAVAAFEGKRIAFERRVPEHTWKSYAIKELDLADDPAAVGREHLARMQAVSPGTRLTLLDDGALHYRFETEAIHPTRFSSAQAFANSLLGPSNGHEPPLIEFADGTPIPDPLWAAITTATESVTHEVEWQSGDVVIIDNTRYMHGRRAILDARRIIHNAQSYL